MMTPRIKSFKLDVSILTIFFLFLVLCTSFGASSAVPSNLTGLECLKVSPSEFLASLKAVRGALQDVTSTLQFELNNVSGFEDSRLSNAISACLDLLALSAEELSWCVSAIDSLQGTHDSTGNGNLSSDLRTWLSATLANTDTCMDEFKGRSIKALMSTTTKIDRVNSLVYELLSQVHTDSVVSDHFTSQLQGQFPSWVGPRDQKLLHTKGPHVDVVVAADGTGNYTKVMDAVDAAPEYSIERFVIYIKRGVYYENVEINEKKLNLVMIGEGMDATIISANRSYSQTLSAYKTATFGVVGKGFIAKDISFMNTAGPLNYQAVALLSGSDRSVFYRCGIFGYQDSLYAHSLCQFYRECKISGTVDFIFGYANAVFQNCQILVKKGLPKQKNTITAQGGRIDRNQQFGFSFQFCNISADSDLLPLVSSTQTFLGRPWKPYSTTVFMQSYISDVLSPEGWLEWNESQNLDTLYYAEYKNYGPGAGLKNRVKWPNYHVMNDSSQASKFTVAQFILGNQWLPSTGVPFTPGLGDQNTTGGNNYCNILTFSYIVYI